MGKSKKRWSLFIAPVVVIAICLSMIVGSTFALFTSNDSVNVAVTSGKVSVTATVTEGESVSSLGGDAIGTLKVEGKNVSLDNIVPGDKLSFTVNAVNDSTVSVKYRVKLECTSGYLLMSALNVQLADQTVTGPKSVATGWAELPADGVEVPVSVELPESAGNLYADLNADIAITLEAVQGNATVATEPEEAEILDYSGVVALAEKGIEKVSTADEFIAAVENGAGVVKVAEDITLNQTVEVAGDLCLVGNGTSVTLPADSTNKTVLGANNLDEDVSIKLVGVNVLNDVKYIDGYPRAISFYNNAGNVTLELDDCNVATTYYGINVASANENVEVIVKNSEVKGWCAFQSWSSNAKFTFENCTLIGLNDKPYNAAGSNDFATIKINGNDDITVENIEIVLKNCTVVAESLNGNGQTFFTCNPRSSGSIVCENCTFIYNGVNVTAEEILGDWVEYANAIVNDYVLLFADDDGTGLADFTFDINGVKYTAAFTEVPEEGETETEVEG